MNHWELSILDWIRHTLGCPFLDAVMPWISRPVDNGILWIALAALLLCLRRTRRTGVSMAAALLMLCLFAAVSDRYPSGLYTVCSDISNTPTLFFFHSIWERAKKKNGKSRSYRKIKDRITPLKTPMP